MNRLVEISGFKASEEKAALLEFIRNCKDPEVLRYKKILTENVPYRLQAPFLDLKTNDWNVGKKQLNSQMVEGRLYAPDLTREEFSGRLSEIVLPALCGGCGD